MDVGAPQMGLNGQGEVMRIAFLVSSLLLAGATPVVAASLPFKGDWKIVAISGAPAFDPGKTGFKALPDGHVASTVGCNRIVGSPEVDGARATFGRMAATMMACPPPLDAVERAYLKALEGVRSWRKDGRAPARRRRRGDARQARQGESEAPAEVSGPQLAFRNRPTVSITPMATTTSLSNFSLTVLSMSAPPQPPIDPPAAVIAA